MVYQVIMEDEYHNLYHLGFYKNLKSSLIDINGWLKIYGVNLQQDELTTYSSTFDSCFDKTIEIEDGLYVYLRGFVFENIEIEQDF